MSDRQSVDERWLDRVAFWISAGMDKLGAENMADFEAHLIALTYAQTGGEDDK